MRQPNSEDGPRAFAGETPVGGDLRENPEGPERDEAGGQPAEGEGAESEDRAEAALVIGGGIAGIQAAIDLAESDLRVYLVERSPSLGGRMAQLDKTFPTMDCSI